MRPFGYRTPEERARDGRSCYGGPVEVRGTGAPRPPAASAEVAFASDELRERLVEIVCSTGPQTARELADAWPGHYMPVALAREELVEQGRLQFVNGRYAAPASPELVVRLHEALKLIADADDREFERRRRARERSYQAIREAERRLRRTGGPTPPDHVRSPWLASRTFARRQM